MSSSQQRSCDPSAALMVPPPSVSFPVMSLNSFSPAPALPALWHLYALPMLFLWAAILFLAYLPGSLFLTLSSSVQAFAASRRPS